MNWKIIQKAIYYYYSGLVTKLSETKYKSYFEIDGEKVYFVRGTGQLWIRCTCKACTYKSKENPLCARKLACLFYQYHEELKKQRKKEAK